MYGSLYLYSDHMLLEEYTIIIPNIINIQVDTNSILSIFFINITYIKYIYLNKKNNILLYHFFFFFLLENILLINIMNIIKINIIIVTIMVLGTSFIVNILSLRYILWVCNTLSFNLISIYPRLSPVLYVFTILSVILYSIFILSNSSTGSVSFISSSAYAMYSLIVLSSTGIFFNFVPFFIIVRVSNSCSWRWWIILYVSTTCWVLYVFKSHFNTTIR